MTTVLAGKEIAQQIGPAFPQAVIESGGNSAQVRPEDLLKVVEFLKNEPALSYNYLTDLTAVDYQNHFEVVYRLSSLEHNTMLALKVRCYDRESPTLPSITGLYRGADLMEREVFDLMGISFSGHPNLERLFLWEGFQGHPLRKDYL
jgi:NADH-quinone oxidoreductase subunit C